MAQTRSSRVGWGWYYPAKVTGLFLVIATLSMTLLAYVGVDHFRSGNEGHVNIRVEQSARTATTLFETIDDGFVAVEAPTGSPLRLEVDEPERLSPSPEWDEYVDSVSRTNGGAANVFRYDADAGSFDRIATSFTTPDGERVGGSEIESGIITAGHPAWTALVNGEVYQGEVPVAGRLRFAYLTPIVDTAGDVVGALAVDAGWVDDLNFLNDRVSTSTWMIMVALLATTAMVAIMVMLWAFRPLNRLIHVAQDLAEGEVPDHVPMTGRRGEIGVLANALARTSELQADLTTRATTDELTGLANRALFLEELTRRLATADLQRDECALLLIDLDQFKEVNDALGHAAGDELLVTIAASLRSVLTPGEFLARLGGDEFALLTCPINSQIDADEVAQRMTDAVTEVARTSVAEIGVTCSIGITILPHQADTAALALSHADLALYRVKRAGRAHWQFFQSSLEAPVLRRVHIATELRRAIRDDDIEVDFQPIFSWGGSRVIGLETLARWNHPVEGRIPPHEFISVAENAGLINDLGDVVLELACGFAADLRGSGLPAPPVSVNASTIQLWQHDFFDRVIDALARHRLPGEALCLEITESVMVHHADSKSRQLLQQLADAGVQLSIDDFGTGYSALSYLQNLDVHQLKIDRAFMAGAVENAPGRRLLQGIVSLGQSLGMQVVAEGIETHYELAVARELGSDGMQGFLLSPPLGANAVRDLLGKPMPLSEPGLPELPRRQPTAQSIG